MLADIMLYSGDRDRPINKSEPSFKARILRRLKFSDMFLITAYTAFPPAGSEHLSFPSPVAGLIIKGG